MIQYMLKNLLPEKLVPNFCRALIFLIVFDFKARNNFKLLLCLRGDIPLFVDAFLDGKTKQYFIFSIVNAKDI